MTNFLDSNILLYCIDANSPKKVLAREFTTKDNLISVQVLNEFIYTSKRKSKLDLPEILEALDALTENLTVVPLTTAMQKRAVEIALATNFNIYDCNIIAAAELSGCDTLYTEDLNNGQRIGKLAIVNPFV